MPAPDSDAQMDVPIDIGHKALCPLSQLGIPCASIVRATKNVPYVALA